MQNSKPNYYNNLDKTYIKIWDLLEVGYKNFCIIEAFILSIGWLYLASKGHRRAKFFLKNNHVDKKWLIP